MTDSLGTVPAGPSVNGTIVATDVLLKDPKKIARAISPGPETFVSDFLFRRDTTDSGAVVFSRAQANGAYPEIGGVEEIQPGANFPMVDIGEDTQLTAVVTKIGAAFRVTDESVNYKRYDEVNAALLRTRNDLVRQNAHNLYASMLAAGIPTRAATDGWNTANADPRRDIRGAQASVRGRGLGYNPRTILAHPDTLFELEMNPLFANWMPRENAALNPFLNAGLNGFLNVEYVELASMAPGEVILLERGMIGVDVVSREVEVEAIREAGQKTLYQVSRSAVPVVTDPFSAVRIQGVIV